MELYPTPESIQLVKSCSNNMHEQGGKSVGAANNSGGGGGGGPVFLNVMDAVVELLPFPFNPQQQYSINLSTMTYSSSSNVPSPPPPPPSPPPPPPLPYNNYIALSTGASTLHILATPSSISANAWHAAISLAAWEYARICMLYTQRLLRRYASPAATTTNVWAEVGVPVGKTDFGGTVLWEGPLK